MYSYNISFFVHRPPIEKTTEVTSQLLLKYNNDFLLCMHTDSKNFKCSCKGVAMHGDAMCS